MADQRERLNMSGSNQAVFMNQRSFGPPPGQEAFTTAGTFTWVAPALVTAVSVVAIGGGGLRGGGGLGYKNNYSVTPGSSYTVVVGAGNTGTGGNSTFVNASTLRGGGGVCGTQGGTFTGDGGGNGGGTANMGGGGAGGYSGNGGRGSCQANGLPGSGGGAGGGAGTVMVGICFAAFWGGGGGGTGILGQGANGAGGVRSGCFAGGGGGGSGGNNGTAGTSYCDPGTGGLYGGAGSLSDICFGGCYSQNTGAGVRGAVRIIWPGCARSFPSTRTANE
jgi:hypothetical protein